MHEEPTAEQFLDAFDGRIYAPAGRQTSVIGRSMGWGGSGEAVSSLSLQFLIRAREESVIVEVSKEGHRSQPMTALHHLVFEAALLRTPRFPIVIERGKQRIPVDGHERVFTTYTAGPAAVAVAAIRDLDVMIRCPTSRLPKLALGIIDPAEIQRVFRDRERRMRRNRRARNRPD